MVVVQVGTMKIHVIVMEALRGKKRGGGQNKMKLNLLQKMVHL
jgi:hypothetical protein